MSPQREQHLACGTHSAIRSPAGSFRHSAERKKSRTRPGRHRELKWLQASSGTLSCTELAVIKTRRVDVGLQLETNSWVKSPVEEDGANLVRYRGTQVRGKHRGKLSRDLSCVRIKTPRRTREGE